MKIKIFDLSSMEDSAMKRIYNFRFLPLSDEEKKSWDEIAQIQYLSGEQLDSICKKYNSIELDLDDNLTVENILFNYFHVNSFGGDGKWVQGIYRFLASGSLSLLDENLSLKEIGLNQDDILFYITYWSSYFRGGSIDSIQDQNDFKKKIARHPKNILKGVFLYTDEDKKLRDYIKEHINSLDKLTGDWCKIYVLEKKHKSFSLGSMSTLFHPPNKAEAYDIADQLGILRKQLPCLVFLPPLTAISGQEKLIIPINIKDEEIPASYFREMFDQLNNIVKQTEEPNRYQEIKIKFDTIVKYLETTFQKVSETTTTTYNISKKISIVTVRDNTNVGNISDSEGIAIGKGATGTVQTTNQLPNASHPEA